MPFTIAELYTKALMHVDKEIVAPLTANKGATGLLLETLTGIPHSSNSLDCLDGELKVYPVIRRGNTFVPKETIAVCMLSKEDLVASPFATSRPGVKMSSMLLVPYERKGDIIVFYQPYIFFMSEHPRIADTLSADYEAIRETFVRDGTLTSKTGTLLQNRTKGPGHGSISRAFYLRKEFMFHIHPIHVGALIHDDT